MSASVTSGSVGVELAGLAEREQPLDEVVDVLHLVVRERPEVGERPPFGVGLERAVELDQVRHGWFS